ncbi:unnamed protein product [Linum trigynum]|uniref:Uncharacterized protein n=1 Tax=Linum trigynum TaxID=586398 RepID=A0AAV2EHQ9_9ROSI
MKLSAEFGWMIALIIVLGTHTVASPSRNPFFREIRNLELSPQILTVTGCNNHCDTACCNCNIEKQPPVCEQCCL